MIAGIILEEPTSVGSFCCCRHFAATYLNRLQTWQAGAVSLISLHLRDERRRSALFVAIVLVVTLVMDGLPQVASPVAMQILLLPFTALFILLVLRLLDAPGLQWLGAGVLPLASPRKLLWLLVVLELSSAFLFFYETRHYAEFGYKLLWRRDLLAFVFILLLLLVAARVGPTLKLIIFLTAHAVGATLAIRSFPLIYLRSDMLPVIQWADRALLSGQNPYQHFYVAERIYDFPYLPGMLLVFAPTQALHLDPRWAGLVYLLAGASLVYWATDAKFRGSAVLLIGIVLLCPYLQYRHDLYTQGHFLSLIAVFVLMQRRHYGWAAMAFGASMLISQFSWVIYPFFLLHSFRRGRSWEVGRTALLSLFAVAIFSFPFLTSGGGTIAHNAVGQWDNLIHPIARPINLSFWASYVIRPVNLKWLQLVVLSAIFGFCILRDRCRDLEDTLRWMITALTVFILLNVLVDGYFYLMLLVPLLVYTCVANGWWAEPHRRLRPEVQPLQVHGSPS